jgi:hypothetical protein
VGVSVDGPFSQTLESYAAATYPLERCARLDRSCGIRSDSKDYRSACLGKQENCTSHILLVSTTRKPPSTSLTETGIL